MTTYMENPVGDIYHAGRLRENLQDKQDIDNTPVI